MRDDRGPSRRINAAAPRGPPPRGPPPLGAASRLRHESMMAFEYWSLRGFVLELPGTKWSRGSIFISQKMFSRMLVRKKYAHISYVRTF